MPDTIYRVLGRALVVWFAIMIAESLNGTFRILFLIPALGEFRAKQIAFASALVLMLLIAAAGIRWIKASGGRQLFLIGLLWVVLTFCFELLLGVCVMGMSGDDFAADYDPSRGGLMGFGLLYMLFLPWIADRLRRLV